MRMTTEAAQKYILYMLIHVDSASLCQHMQDSRGDCHSAGGYAREPSEWSMFLEWPTERLHGLIHNPADVTTTSRSERILMSPFIDGVDTGVKAREDGPKKTVVQENLFGGHCSFPPPPPSSSHLLLSSRRPSTCIANFPKR